MIPLVRFYVSNYIRLTSFFLSSLAHPSSVMKNLAESQHSKAHQLGGLSEELIMSGANLTASSAAASGSSSSPWSGTSWDLRDETRADGPWKLKTDLLSDAFYETVLHGLASSFHDNKRRPLPEDVPGDTMEPPRRTDHELLSAAFNRILCAASQRRSTSDVVGTLKLWVLLNGDSYGGSNSSGPASISRSGSDVNLQGRQEDAASSSSSSADYSSSSRADAAIVLSADAIRSCLEALAKIPAMDAGDWTAVLRSLAWLSSPRWLLTERLQKQQQQQQPDENAMEVEEGSESLATGPAELADQMCAGPVIGSPNLCRILFSLISGQGLAPSSLADKQLVRS